MDKMLGNLMVVYSDSLMAATKVVMWALQMAVETAGAKVATTGDMTVSSLAVCSALDLAVRSANKSDVKTVAMMGVSKVASTAGTKAGSRVGPMAV